jgi:hypothetical protein
MRITLRVAILVLASVALAAAAYTAWVDLVVYRGDCGPYSCGWPGRFTWNAPEAVFGFFLATAGLIVVTVWCRFLSR